MQCQRCGSHIPNGELFCPICGQEVQLVPDYDSVEYMIQQKRVQEELKKKEVQEQQKLQAIREKKIAELKKKKKKKLILITLFSIVFVSVLIVSAVYFVQYSRDNSYEYQYAMAYEAYKAEDYITAASYAEKALKLSPDNDNAILLTAEIKIHNGDIDGGAELFKTYIQKHPDSVDAYARLISIYEERMRYDDIKSLMINCNNDNVLTNFSAYIPVDVRFLTEPGAYSSKIKIELEFDSGTVYYTTDGSDPTDASEVYSDPVMLEEGTTTFKAVAYSEAGIVGEIVSAEYTVTLVPPDPPFISPSSGDYETGTQITIVVPDGCKAYYSFDGEVSSDSKLYTGPINMPEGEHVFTVISVDSNGKQSYPVSEIYVVE